MSEEGNKAKEKLQEEEEEVRAEIQEAIQDRLDTIRQADRLAGWYAGGLAGGLLLLGGDLGFKLLDRVPPVVASILLTVALYTASSLLHSRVIYGTAERETKKFQRRQGDFTKQQLRQYHDSQSKTLNEAKGAATRAAISMLVGVWLFLVTVWWDHLVMVFEYVLYKTLSPSYIIPTAVPVLSMAAIWAMLGYTLYGRVSRWLWIALPGGLAFIGALLFTLLLAWIFQRLAWIFQS